MSVLQLVGIQIVTFALLILLLKKIFYNDLGNAKKRLVELNEQNQEREKELKTRIADAEKERKRILADADADAEKVRTQAGTEAERVTSEALESIKKEKEAIMAAAGDKYSKMKNEMTSALERKSLDQACEIVKGLLTENIKENIQFQLIDDLIQDISNLEDGRIRLQAGKGIIYSPLAITEEQKNRLLRIISQKSGKDISFEEVIDESLIMGMKLDLEGLIIDGSLKNKLDKIKGSCQ